MTQAALEEPAAPARWGVRFLRAFQIDIRALAAMRIVLGLSRLFDLTSRLPLLRVYYTDWGVSPRSLAEQGLSGKLTFYAINGSYAWAVFVTTVHITLAIMFTIGYRTRLATIGLAVMLYSLINRNPTLAHSGNNLDLWLLIWSIFFPLGAAASVDAVRARFDWRRNRFRRVYSIASAAILLQVALVYLNAFAVKGAPEWSSNFVAIGLFMRGGWATPLGHLFGQLNFLNRPFTAATMMLELLGPAVALVAWDMPRTRSTVAITFIIFHLGLLLTMYVGTFALICAAGWLLFLPHQFWDRVASWPLVNALIAIWNRIMEACATLLRFPSNPRVQSIRLHPTAQTCVALLLAYVIVLNLATDVRTRVFNHRGALPILPSLKQSWGVMDVAGVYFQTITIELQLADGSTHILTAKDSPYFDVTLPRAPTQAEFWRGWFPPEIEHCVQYRMTMLYGALLGPTPALRHFCEFHRRIWDEEHSDPGAKIVGLKAYCDYIQIVGDEMPADFQPHTGRWLLHAWPVDVEPVSQRGM